MINITKSQLRKMYYENTNDEVCKILGVSKITLLKYLMEADIPLKGKGGGMVGSGSKKIMLVD